MNNEISPIYLRNLCITIPVESDEKVRLFKKIEKELQVEQIDLLGAFQVHFEHVALEKAYIPILKELIQHGKEYDKAYKKEDKRVKGSNTKKRKKYESAKSDYDNSFFFTKWFKTEPSKPTYQKNTKQKLVSSIQDLIKNSEALHRIIILDAGGLSTDISVLEYKHGNYQKLSASKSFVECGGEQLSGQIGRKRTGEKGTKYKVVLGQKYDRNVTDKKLVEYKEKTGIIYGNMVEETLSFIRKSWGRKQFLVLTVGGGSENPYLQQLLKTKLDEHNLVSFVLNADDFNKYIEDALSFGMRLSNSCLNFQKAAKEKAGTYFPHSLVLGMWNQGR